MSIYESLFAYRPRPDRKPTEDFLSAALADLLNRLPLKEHAMFVADVLLADRLNAKTAWRAFMAERPRATLQWFPQYRVQNGKGIIDLLLKVDRYEALAIENKIGAPVRDHSHEDIEGATQLHTYGKWLGGRCGDRAWPGALVMLTHFSNPPANFEPTEYGVPYVGVCRWRDVWSWARSKSPKKDDESRPSGTWMDMKAEFADFLKGQNMTADYMTRPDLARVEVFVAGASRVSRTFEAIKEKLKGVLTELGRGTFDSIQYNGEGAVAWSWFYLRGPPNAKWFIGWGLRFPENSQWWTECEPPLPSEPHAFVLLGADGTPKLPVDALAADARPGEWVIIGDELVVGRKLCDFPADADGLAHELAKWIETSITELRPALMQLLAAPTAS